MPKLLTEGVSLEQETGRQLIGIVAGLTSNPQREPRRRGPGYLPGEQALQQQADCVDRIWRFLPLIFFPASYPHGWMQRLLFRGFDALAVDDCRRRTSLAPIASRHSNHPDCISHGSPSSTPFPCPGRIKLTVCNYKQFISFNFFVDRL